MRDKLWLILHEGVDGEVSVQAYSTDPKESFDNLKGVVGDKPSRATLMAFDFADGSVKAWSKNLPEVEDKQNAPDGWRLGVGPVWFDEEKDEE